MIHLICGPIGAGKTTIAHKISKQHKAIRFSEDEWLDKLFVPDAPNGLLDEPMHIIGAWAGERYQRCRNQIWDMCAELLELDIDIVLDGASANKEQRDFIRKKASDTNVKFQLYYVTLDATVRKERVFQRNEAQGKTYSLEVTPDMFTHAESFFVPPSKEELIDAIIIDNSI